MTTTSNFLQAGQKLQSHEVSFYDLHNPHLTMATGTAGIGILSNMVTLTGREFWKLPSCDRRHVEAAKNPRTVIKFCLFSAVTSLNSC